MDKAHFAHCPITHFLAEASLDHDRPKRSPLGTDVVAVALVYAVRREAYSKVFCLTDVRQDIIDVDHVATWETWSGDLTAIDFYPLRSLPVGRVELQRWHFHQRLPNGRDCIGLLGHFDLFFSARGTFATNWPIGFFACLLMRGTSSAGSGHCPSARSAASVLAR